MKRLLIVLFGITAVLWFTLADDDNTDAQDDDMVYYDNSALNPDNKKPQRWMYNEQWQRPNFGNWMQNARREWVQDYRQMRGDLQSNWESFHEEFGTLEQFLVELSDQDKETLKTQMQEYMQNRKELMQTFMQAVQQDGDVNSAKQAILDHIKGQYDILLPYVQEGMETELQEFLDKKAEMMLENLDLRAENLQNREEIQNAMSEKLKEKFEKFLDRVEAMWADKEEEILNRLLDKIEALREKLDSMNKLSDKQKELLYNMLDEMVIMINERLDDTVIQDEMDAESMLDDLLNDI